MNKAETLHFKDDTYFFTGAGQKFQVPSVIRLKYTIKRKSNPVYKVSRLGIYSRDNFSCQYCGQKHIDLTLDHIYPKHLGGVTSWQNLVTSCKKCNYKKAGKTLEKSGMNLLSNPKVPRYSFSTILSKHKDSIDENWKYYITI